MTQNRPPILTVVGHIDHGKSSLQRTLRSADTEVVEAGDITQHIGAYELHADCDGTKRKATIIDTPGHEAFSHIREHGIGLADLVLLVISSEEGWKEQTGETYGLIQKAGKPFIIVFTKTDTEKSDIEKAKQSVLREGVLLEKLGGSVPWVGISSKTGERIDELIELIFLTADVYEITESRGDGSVGIMVEADIDRRTGIAGTVIVLRNSLEQGGYLQAGSATAPLRIIRDDRGRSVESAVPSMPVRVIGFDTIPPIGEPVFLHATKKSALEAAKKAEGGRETPRTTEENGIPVIVRADTVSGLTTVRRALSDAAADKTVFTVIREEVGEITEEDIRFALMKEGVEVIGFHTDMNRGARHIAENGAPVSLFKTVYEVTDWAKKHSREKREQYEMEHRTGTGTVIRMFEEQAAKNTHIVGVQIRDGQFTVGQSIAVIRNGNVAGRGLITSIEQRNRKEETVSGPKSQFAMRVTGAESVAVDDTVAALPVIE